MLCHATCQGPLANNTLLREAVKLFEGKVQGSGAAPVPAADVHTSPNPSWASLASYLTQNTSVLHWACLHIRMLLPTHPPAALL